MSSPSGKADIPPLPESQRTKDNEWDLLCDDCKTSGPYDVEILKHKNHHHKVVPAINRSNRWN